MLKILISAYACEPNTGSESGIGWNFVRSMGKLHELWVITRKKNRRAIEAALANDQMPNVRWIYYDIPGGQYITWDGTRSIYPYHHYFLWQLGAYFAIRKLHRQTAFDLIHHVTFVNYWLPTFMPFLDAPFVWGPVGGGEVAPKSMNLELGFWARCSEWMRDVVRNASSLNPGVRYAAKRAIWGFATTKETAERLMALGCNTEVLPAVALPEEEIDRLSRLTKRPHTRFRVVSIGDLLPVKGFETGLRGFAEFRRNCSEAEYWLIGEGRERKRLQKTARSLGLQGSLVFWGRMPREQVLEKLSECDVLLFPSLHDSGGWVSLEAMAAGLPVICLDQGGPALQVTSETGFRIAVQSPAQVVEDIARALSLLYNDPELRAKLGAAGRERVKNHFSWRQKAERISATYDEIVRSRFSNERRLAERLGAY